MNKVDYVAVSCILTNLIYVLIEYTDFLKLK